MKIMQALIVTLSLCFAHGAVWGVSIVYDGSQCLNTADSDDPTPQGTPVQSKFEVIEDAGDGLYRLRVTGGIPRFVNNNNTVCIDSETSLGYSGLGVNDIPRPLDAADATAYFNGHDLIIVINAVYTDLSARREPLSSFSTSRIFAYSHTLILEFNSSVSQFVLKKYIRNRGYTQTSGSTNNLTIPFFETVLPSFNSELLDQPKILTPVSSIAFRLE